MISDPVLQAAIHSVPAGAYAVGVSGGADSVALVTLLRERTDLRLHVVHLNHQLRGNESDADETFVRLLAEKLKLPATIDTLANLGPALAISSANQSAYYRAARLALFRRVVHEHAVAGVLLAHHRLDQAETILQRLSRNAGVVGLNGMSFHNHVEGVHVFRPLLSVDPQSLRDELNRHHQPWREDSSNRSDVYQRNRLRPLLRENSSLVDELIGLADACRSLTSWLDTIEPVSSEPLSIRAWDGLPPFVRQHVARRWLTEVAGVPTDDASPAAADRLLLMMDDVATAARVDLPGQIHLSRRRGHIEANRA